jgi:ketosteroid isomerase-like protein
MGSTEETRRIARAYYEAWTSGDGPAASAVLADDFRFVAGDMSIEGKEAFLDVGAFPRDGTTKLVAEAYEGDMAFQMYDASRGDLTVRIVEQLTIRDGAIASSTFVTDMAAFGRLIGG